MLFQPFADSRVLIDHPGALRQRMQEEGYLFISGLIPGAEANAVYEAIMCICREEGWADEQNLALGEPCLEGHEGWWEVYDRVQCLEEFHALAHHSNILRVIEAIVQEPVLVHPRNIARITFPATAHYTTPPHQDYPLIQGTPDTYCSATRDDLDVNRAVALVCRFGQGWEVSAAEAAPSQTKPACAG